MVGPLRASLRPMTSPAVAYITLSTLLRVAALRTFQTKSIEPLSPGKAAWSRLCHGQVKLSISHFSLPTTAAHVLHLPILVDIELAQSARHIFKLRLATSLLLTTKILPR